MLLSRSRMASIAPVMPCRHALLLSAPPARNACGLTRQTAMHSIAFVSCSQRTLALGLRCPNIAARRGAVAVARSSLATPETGDSPSPPGPALSNLPIAAIINQQGYVSPDVPPDAAAAVFAVYDSSQKLQYIGFSRELRASLRTVLGRRPDKAFFYKATTLPEVDQDRMLALRQAWFDECGAPPPGNKLALERKAWQSAVDAGAISARARPAAAADKARELQAALRARGCVEEFVPDPTLLSEGQVDFMQPDHSSGGAEAAGAAADAAAAAAAAAASASARPVRTGTAVVDGQAKQYTVTYLLKHATRGGHIFDVRMTFDHMDTEHRIIVSRRYYEPYGLAPEAPVDAALGLLLSLRLPRHTEGMLPVAQFPVNYFTISEVEQWFPDAFAAAFLQATGADLEDGTDSMWRMNRLHDYGGKLEDPQSLSSALGSLGGLGSAAG